MRPASDVRRVFELRNQGLSKAAISRETGVSRAQVRTWLELGLEAVLSSPMRCRSAEHSGTICELVAGVDERAYAYLFGQYLGDGWLSESKPGVHKFRIAMCDDYPGIRRECEDAIRAVMPGRRVGGVQRIGYTEVTCYSAHWVCLFPQHSSGRKHERRLVLRNWQEEIVFMREPRLFLRGLVHSDGCRVTNTVVRPVAGERKLYSYPRYFFTNESRDIREFFREACTRIGVESRLSRPNTVSVARRQSVLALDAFIGAKC